VYEAVEDVEVFGNREAMWDRTDDFRRPNAPRWHLASARDVSEQRAHLRHGTQRGDRLPHGIGEIITASAGSFRCWANLGFAERVFT